MKKIISLMVIPVLYAGVMIFKTPNFPDALIVLALSAMSCFLAHILTRSEPKERKESIVKLEEELQEERLRLSLEQIKQNSIKEKAIRDARSTVESYSSNKGIRF